MTPKSKNEANEKSRVAEDKAPTGKQNAPWTWTTTFLHEGREEREVNRVSRASEMVEDEGVRRRKGCRNTEIRTAMD
jgi:hypothetical protein